MTLVAHSLSVRLGSRAVVENIDLTLAPGECVGLIGPNGAGKSTLLRAFAGALPHSGTLTLDGAPLAALDARTRARQIGYLAQTRDVAWPLEVAEVVALGRLPHRPPLARPSRKDREAVAEALRLVGLAPLADRRVDRLSGGELARVLIGRLIAQDSPIVLADEPVAGLDPAHQITTMRLFRDLARGGRAVLVSLHDLTLAARWCDRLVLIDRGRIVAEGAPADILTADRLSDVYGVDALIGETGGKPLVVPLGLVDHRTTKAPP